jgi:signal transduction histidine kinase
MKLFDTNLLDSKFVKSSSNYSWDKSGLFIDCYVSWGASIVLQNLSEILIIAYPLILISFSSLDLLRGSIKPISAIIATSNIITKNNLKSRIELPRKKMNCLSKTINNLLDRIETAVEEKQFTSDASHELRTPLTVIGNAGYW